MVWSRNKPVEVQLSECFNYCDAVSDIRNKRDWKLLENIVLKLARNEKSGCDNHHVINSRGK